jgi:Zinc knuckle
LQEEAYQFYQEVIKDKVNELGEAFKLLENTHASIARQEQTKTMLQSLNTKFCGHDQSHLSALNDIYSDISRLAAQCSPKYRDNQSKADFLKAAVKKQPCARGAVEEYLSNPSSFMPNKFQGFHGRLTSALTARVAAGDQDDTDPTKMNHTEPIHVFPTHFGSKYGVHAPPKQYSSPTASPRNILSNVPPRLSDAEWQKLTPDEKKLRRTCFKCGQKGHYSVDLTCTRSENSMTDSIKARYRESGNDSMAASTILF